MVVFFVVAFFLLLFFYEDVLNEKERTVASARCVLEVLKEDENSS